MEVNSKIAEQEMAEKSIENNSVIPQDKILNLQASSTRVIPKISTPEKKILRADEIDIKYFWKEKKIDTEFIILTENIKKYLLKIKTQFDSHQNNLKNKADQINFINHVKNQIYQNIEEYFQQVHQIIANLDKENYIIYQKYYQYQLLPILATEPLNKRIYEKPLGYPGDYIMMQHYYRDEYEGLTLFDKLMHRYTLELPISRAHINRKEYFINKIKFLANNSNEKFTKIASFGCGAGIEIIDFVKMNQNLNKCIFYCLDSEKNSLISIKNNIEKINHNININYYEMNILDLVKKKNIYNELKDIEFIYCSGLFDYFNQKIAKHVLKVLYSLLAKNGELVIVNVHKNHNSKVYMEFLGEWYLNLRDENDMLDLAKCLPDPKNIQIEKDHENGKNLYLKIHK